jgi:hypothetical protein
LSLHLLTCLSPHKEAVEMAGSQISREPAQYRRSRFAAGGIYCYERLCKCPFILVMGGS